MPAMPMMKPEQLMESCGKLLEQLRVLNLSWMNCVQQSVDSNWELATQLSKCGDPAEFTSVCRDWANERRDAMIADGRTLSALCFKVCQSEMPGMTTSESSNVSAIRPAAVGD